MAPVNLLIIDDEKDFAETLAERLEKRGYIISCAFNGREALKIIEKHKEIEVVILDIKMPGMDGIETLKGIRKINPLVEIILLTGHSTVKTAVEGLKHGAFDYLLKPIEFDDLLSRINDAASKEKLHEKKLRDVQTTPYISNTERKERIESVEEEMTTGGPKETK
ncbi:MAG: response regulator [Desulfobacterales bacterium]|nr:response regulator [Desulfobacterales bacterium]